MRRLLIIFFCLLVSGTTLATTSIPQVQLLLAKKQFAGAAQKGETLLRQHPGHLRTLFLTAYAHQMSANEERAIALYQEMISSNPELPEPRNNLAMIYLAQGDYDRASELLVEAINTHSSYAIAYANLRQVYKGIASEAYRRAVSESSEPANYNHDIDLIAITWLDTVAPDPDPVPDSVPDPIAIAVADPVPDPVAVAVAVEDPDTPTLVNTANQETLLIEQVKDWAAAWSDKDIASYTGHYSPQYRSKFASHEQWVKHRRGRIERPGTIKIEASDFQVKWDSDKLASVDFTQAYNSARYSDRVVKRLDFRLVDSQWKITAERVLSVL